MYKIDRRRGGGFQKSYARTDPYCFLKSPIPVNSTKYNPFPLWGWGEEIFENLGGGGRKNKSLNFKLFIKKFIYFPLKIIIFQQLSEEWGNDFSIKYSHLSNLPNILHQYSAIF